MKNTTKSPFRTLADFRAANAASGRHFFDGETMRFWKTRIESTLIRGRYFITSEDTWSINGGPTTRVFAVRRAEDDASVTTVEQFLPTKGAARDAVARLTAAEVK